MSVISGVVLNKYKYLDLFLVAAGKIVPILLTPSY